MRSDAALSISFIFFIFFLNSNICFAQNFDGFALFNPSGTSTTKLIDEQTNIVHTWNMNTDCNYAVQLKKNGNLVRGTKYSNNVLNGAAVGGSVQEIDPQGNIVWEYVYSSSDYVSHHDLTLIGDNVLLTAWEVKTATEVYNAGYTGNVGNSGKWPTHFIELEPDGNGSASIIWEWHIWDHLCQDVDPNKPNYVNDISDHPELIDINMIQGGGGNNSGDWFHVNGVDYNEELDQIVFSSRFSSEIYIIDHSTTTSEAASHSGGNSGMGGDILYRWGNPSNYGINGPQVIPDAVHDVRWIENDGRQNSGYLQIFNNKGGSSNPVQSTIDGIETPLDSTTGYTYLRNLNQPFGPSSYTTRYICQYSAPGQSASDRMSNGNIYVNASGGQGGSGVMYEVDSIGNIVWGPYQADSQKGFRYECDYPGIIALWTHIDTSTTSCNPLSINSVKNENDFKLYPNPTSSTLNIDFTNKKIRHLNIYNTTSKLVDSYKVNNFYGKVFSINFNAYDSGIYFLELIDDTGSSYKRKFSYIK